MPPEFEHWVVLVFAGAVAAEGEIESMMSRAEMKVVRREERREAVLQLQCPCCYDNAMAVFEPLPQPTLRPCHAVLCCPSNLLPFHIPYIPHHQKGYSSILAAADPQPVMIAAARHLVHTMPYHTAELACPLLEVVYRSLLLARSTYARPVNMFTAAPAAGHGRRRQCSRYTVFSKDTFSLIAWQGTRSFTLLSVLAARCSILPCLC